MVRCYQCAGIGDASLDPCPEDPPCKPYDVCGFWITECHHKNSTVEVPVKLSADDLDSKTMLLNGLPKVGKDVRYTEAYRTWNKRRQWQTARCVGAEIDCWGDPYYILEPISADSKAD